MKISKGVDLHKKQFATCMMSEYRKLEVWGVYPTQDIRSFCKEQKSMRQKVISYRQIVECTENR